MALQLGSGLPGRLIGGVVSLALAGGAYFLFFKGQEAVSEANAPDTGPGLHMMGRRFAADPEDRGCGPPGAPYVVVGDDGSCDKVEISYTITLGSGDEGNVADLCLVLNAAQGDCFKLGGISSPDEKVDCAAAKGDPDVARIVAVGDSATDDCPKGSQRLSNKTRDTLLCLGVNA